MGSVHADTSTTEFCEAGYGDLHQINVTGSIGVHEGEEVDGRTQSERGLDQAIRSSGDLVRLAINYLNWNARVREANLWERVEVSEMGLVWRMPKQTFQGCSMVSGRTRRPAHSG